MGATLFGAASDQPLPPSGPRRPENLALTYQEILTATVRIRASRQAVADARSFRAKILEELRRAEKTGIGKGYMPEDVRLATTAVVAFLDESVLNSANPAFSDWSGMSLQQELFGHNVAGESFFDNLDRLQNRSDSQDVADILELHCLCLLLGFRGRYSMSDPAAIRPLIEMLAERVRRIRGAMTGLSPSWKIPEGVVVTSTSDPWGRRLLVVALVCFLLAVGVFLGFRFLLGAGISELRAISVLVPL